MDSLTSRNAANLEHVHAYSAKVRGITYLWGSASISTNLTFEKAPMLSIANDPAGEPVKIGTQVATGATTELGTLKPGERVSVSINDLTGIYADCASESLVHCVMC
ncbi:MAG: hypothetical protein M3Z20_13785 [Chloroflexota bacterium]|nr:hypothetical protein [Chloroflexota bacterium]